MIRCMVMEHSIGLMEESIKALGKMENSMEEDSTFCQMDNLKLANGLMERKANGLHKLKKDNRN